MIHAAVVGARGYLGRELMRLLHEHPHVEQVTPIATSNIGEPYAKHAPKFQGTTYILAGMETAKDADVVFYATPSGVAKQHASDDQISIDLSRDHRIEAIQTGNWHYGVADLDPAPKGTKRIANPGCYPTAAALAMAPALQAGIVEGAIIVDGKSGVSGAGVAPQPHLHFAEQNESTTAYKVDKHDHTAEMEAFANRHQSTSIRFTPHLIPQTRGLLDTVYIPTTKGETANQLYKEAYADAPFVHVVDEARTGDVQGSNHAHIAVTYDANTNYLIVRAAIDNLRKGGGGTAIQNMNNAFGWDATTGLEARP